MSHSADVLVIGGGLAGCSAAYYAAKRGYRVEVLEAGPDIGGRVRSLFARDVGQWIDNGQHVLSAGYRETRELLAGLGTLHLVEFQKALHIRYRQPDRSEFTLKALPLPAPLHLLIPLFRHMPLPWRERISLLRWALRSRFLSEERLHRMTVSEWLELGGNRSPALETLFWEPLVLATLNTPLQQASAFLLQQVLNQAFLASSSASGLGIPGALLSDIFGNAFRQWFRLHEVNLHCNSPVRSLEVRDKRVKVLRLRDNRLIQVEQIIAAIPANALHRLQPGLCQPQELGASPITTIYFWLSEPLPGFFPCALIDTPLQWIFRLPDKAAQGGVFGYAAVCSALPAFAALDNENIRLRTREELVRFFEAQPALMVDFPLKIVREKQATFLQSPTAEAQRPGTATSLHNLLLAGDWTDTALPATIESAILSGRRAAELLQ